MTIGSTASAESTAHQPIDATGSSRRGRSRGRRSWRRSRLALALGLIITSAVAAGGTATQADGDPPPPPPPPAISVTLETSDDHPGMLLVEWTVDQTNEGISVAPTSNDAAYDAFRLQWSAEGSTSVSESIMVRQNEPFSRLVIPNLSAAKHTVTVSGLPRVEDLEGVDWATANWESTVSATSAQAVTGFGDAGLPACPGTDPEVVPTLVCMALENQMDEAMPDLVLYINTSSSGMYPTEASGDSVYPWGSVFNPEKCEGFPTTSCPVSPVSDYMLARFNYRDRSGVSTSRWWSAFDDDGHLFFSATPVLVPLRPEVGPPVALAFDLDEAGLESIELSGGLFKVSDGAVVGLEQGLSDDDGIIRDEDTYKAVDPRDFINPCIKVFNSQRQFVNLECGYDGSGFSAVAGEPHLWKMRLVKPSGSDFYKVYVVDRANYFGVQNILLYNVKWAAQWIGELDDDGQYSRAENYPSALEITTTTSALNAVLRTSGQLSATVVDVPVGYDHARIIVYDPIADRWLGGEMVKPEPDSGTWHANVTGLVEGRKYRIYFSFDGSAGHRYWLVGGGDLNSGEGVTPGPTLTEPWPNRPYAVTVHNADGSLIEEPNSACVALIRSDDSVAASACNDGDNFFGSFGFIQLQRVVPGTYRAIAWRTNNPENAILVGAVEVPGSDQVAFLKDALKPSGITAAAGISNWAGQSLDGTWSVPKPEPAEGAIDYDTPTNSAVIIP